MSKVEPIESQQEMMVSEINRAESILTAQLNLINELKDAIEHYTGPGRAQLAESADVRVEINLKVARMEEERNVKIEEYQNRAKHFDVMKDQARKMGIKLAGDMSEKQLQDEIDKLLPKVKTIISDKKSPDIVRRALSKAYNDYHAKKDKATAADKRAAYKVFHDYISSYDRAKKQKK